MTKKKVFITVICVVVLLLLLLLLLFNIPWRTRIELEMPCAQIAQDGTVISTGETVTIKGWELKYLNDPESKLVVESFMLPVFSEPAETHSGSPLILSRRKSSPYAAMGWVLYEDDFHDIYISLEDEWKTCLIRFDQDQYFACSLDGTASASEIAEIHKWILD